MAIPIVHDAIEQGRYSLFSQALVASGHRLFFHAFKARKEEKAKRHEIDFLTERNGGLIPIEAKFPSYRGHRSLDVFFEKYKDRKIEEAYVIYTKDLQRGGGSSIFLSIWRG